LSERPRRKLLFRQRREQHVVTNRLVSILPSRWTGTTSWLPSHVQLRKSRYTTLAMTVLTVIVSPRRNGGFCSIRQQCFAAHLQNLWHGSTAAIHWVRSVFRECHCSAIEGRRNNHRERITHANTHPSSNVYILLLPIAERFDVYNSCKYLSLRLTPTTVVGRTLAMALGLIFSLLPFPVGICRPQIPIGPCVD
jgi:hypothetical protein